MPFNALRSCLFAIVLVVLTACSNGGGSSDDGSNNNANGSNGGSNAQPGLQLNDGDVLGGGSSVIRIPADDSGNIVRVGSSIVRQGRVAQRLNRCELCSVLMLVLTRHLSLRLTPFS